MAEFHYIADDLGYDRGRSYTFGAEPPSEDWLSDTEIEMHSWFLHRLGAESEMDKFDG